MDGQQQIRERVHINGRSTTRLVRIYRPEFPAEKEIVYGPRTPDKTRRSDKIFTGRYSDRISTIPYSPPSVSSSSPTLSHTNTASDQPNSPQTPTSSYDTSWFNDNDNESKVDSTISRNSVIVPSIDTSHDSCAVDAEEWFAQYSADLNVPDEAPGSEALEKAGDIPIFDSAGNSRLFKSLYTVGDVVGDRQLVIFVRHFFCGACQAYIQALTQEINMQTYFTMSIPTSIVIIGCGTPELIRQYKARTQCPFPIFADPSRRIFKHLGMSLSLNIGFKRPEYFKSTNETAWLFKQFKEMSNTPGKKKWRSGNWLQVGGEFLFEDGQVVWCHRMKSYRDHAEIDTLKRVLQIDS